MSPIQEKLTDPSNPDDLNELVLEAAARNTGDEVTPDNVIRNETIEAGSHRVAVLPAESAESIAALLVDAGNNEAGLEQRLASAAVKPTQI